VDLIVMVFAGGKQALLCRRSDKCGMQECTHARLDEFLSQRMWGFPGEGSKHMRVLTDQTADLSVMPHKTAAQPYLQLLCLLHSKVQLECCCLAGTVCARGTNAACAQARQPHQTYVVTTPQTAIASDFGDGQGCSCLKHTKPCTSASRYSSCVASELARGYHTV
jgi:hypothetical protein